MKKIFVPLSILALTLGACNNTNKVKEATEKVAENVEAVAKEAVEKVENVLKTENFEGTYEGTLPCADCEGIKTSLTLNADDTYEMTQEYLDKKEVLKSNYKGKFTWTVGGVITLDGLKDMSSLFKVDKDRVYYLDIEGNIITGELADFYILKKK